MLCDMPIHNKRGQKKDPHRIDLKLGELKYEGVDDSLTAAAGLPVMLELFSRSRQFPNFVKNLPSRTSNNTYGTERIALLLWLGFLRGYDCLEDLADFEWDAGVMQKFGEIPTPRSIGNYLRDFGHKNNAGLNEFLRAQALDARQRICPDEPLIIDMDSTSHVQRGNTIEGLAYNYKNEWCLDSLVAFDSLGFCHGMKLRLYGAWRVLHDQCPWSDRLERQGKGWSDPRLGTKKKAHEVSLDEEETFVDGEWLYFLRMLELWT